MTAFLRQEECMHAVEMDVHIRVGRTGADVQALRKEFGEEKVEKANRAWSYNVRVITHMLILQLILAAGSPSAGWNSLKEHCTPQAQCRELKLCLNQAQADERQQQKQLVQQQMPQKSW